ncbi:MAG: hypothetical protein DWB42_05310 [Chloroflexi bacterium]|nr:hypothetical protein [Chloroflexota bacterium]MDL1883303.1 hypothetical protein [Anaerolineae bacterium CFX8]
MSCKSLNDEERTTVSTLETGGFRLRNIQLVTFSYGDTDFDLVMPRSEQERWLTDLDFQDLTGTRVVDDTLRSHYGKSYRRLLEMPFAEEVIQVMRQYIRASIPAVKRGEIAFWMCSCLPGNTAGLYSRINVGN